MGRFLRHMLRSDLHGENRRVLMQIEHVDVACNALAELGLHIRHFENKSNTMPVIEIDYDPAVEKLSVCHLQGAHYYAIVHGCRVEWVHRDTTIQRLP